MFFCRAGRHHQQLEGRERSHRIPGLFASFDRAAITGIRPEAGGKVDKQRPTQFGHALQRLGIEMIAAYSPEARGRSERMFRTHQDRLVRELALAGITDMAAANRYLTETYRPAFNAESGASLPWKKRSAFVDRIAARLMTSCANALSAPSNDNCVALREHEAADSGRPFPTCRSQSKPR
ncbi:MAG: hypothetical protein IPI89_12255 [Propionivibrio sp.]|nr:hypothetical protein [Propionivibrio sp.]